MIDIGLIERCKYGKYVRNLGFTFFTACGAILFSGVIAIVAQRREAIPREKCDLTVFDCNVPDSAPLTDLPPPLVKLNAKVFRYSSIFVG